VKVQPVPVSINDIAQDLEGSKTQVSSLRAYDALSVIQREAIDLVLEDMRRNEVSPFAAWHIAFLKVNKSVIPGTFGPYKAWQTTEIRLIMRRAPRQTPLGPISPSNRYGRTIHTLEPTQDPYNKAWPQTR
jgi:hypothetical protein